MKLKLDFYDYMKVNAGSLPVKKMKYYYIPCKDSNGHELTAEEILFTTEEALNGQQKLDVKAYGIGVSDALEEDDYRENDAKIYTVNSPGVELNFDDTGNFPVSLKSPDGQIMYLKVAATTGEVLPNHAGCCRMFDVIDIGPSGSGKTTSIIQMISPEFHDAIADETGVSVDDDLPSQSPSRKRYDAAGYDFRSKHILPERNRKGEFITPYVYLITNKIGATARYSMLRIQDIDGESCQNIGWDSKILNNNCFFLTIGADELLAHEKGEPVLYVKVVNDLITKLKSLKSDGDYELIVIITKCDLLDKENPYLKDAWDNSIEVIGNGRIRQKIHKKGFDNKAFNKRSKAVKDYLRTESPNLFNKLINNVPEKKLSFCMTASVGTKCMENKFASYNPFSIDEPLLLVLTKNYCYPIVSHEEDSRAEEVQGKLGNGSIFGGMKKFIDNFISAHDEDEWEEEFGELQDIIPDDYSPEEEPAEKKVIPIKKKTTKVLETGLDWDEVR